MESNTTMINPQAGAIVWKEVAKLGVLFVLLLFAVYALWNSSNESQRELKKELNNRIESLEKRLDNCDSDKKDRIEKKIDNILIIIEKSREINR